MCVSNCKALCFRRVKLNRVFWDGLGALTRGGEPAVSPCVTCQGAVEAPRGLGEASAPRAVVGGRAPYAHGASPCF